MLTERELLARAEINWERYVKVGTIRPETALDIAKTMIVPAVAEYLGRLTAGTSSSRGMAKICEEVSEMADVLVDRIEALEHAQHAIHDAGSIEAEARTIVDQVIPAQNALREIGDGGRRKRPTTCTAPCAEVALPG